MQVIEDAFWSPTYEWFGIRRVCLESLYVSFIIFIILTNFTKDDMKYNLTNLKWITTLGFFGKMANCAKDDFLKIKYDNPG